MKHMNRLVRNSSSVGDESPREGSITLNPGNTFGGMAVLVLGELPVAVLRPDSAASFIGIGESTLWDWLNPKSPRHNAQLPQPFELGSKSTGFLVSELWAFLADKAAQRGNGG